MRRTVHIEVIPHHTQRYPTAGDYWENREALQIRVSQLGDPLMERLVAIHELIEWTLCEAKGILEKDIRAFDEAHPDADDPGSLPDAPYRFQHKFAEAVERTIAEELGVDWDEYSRRVEALFE